MKKQVKTRSDGTQIIEWVEDENDIQPTVGTTPVRKSVASVPSIEYMTLTQSNSSTNWLIGLCAYLLFLNLINQ